jgi:hypothetical protein
MQAYTPDFYEIAELTLDGTYTPVESWQWLFQPLRS